MTALSDDKERYQRNIQQKRYRKVTLKTGNTFYTGAMCCYEASGGDVVPAADTSGFRFAGVWEGESTTTTADTDAEVAWGHEEWFPMQGATLAAADYGSIAVIADDQTLSDSATETNDIQCGRVTEVVSKKGASGAFIEVGVGVGTSAA